MILLDMPPSYLRNNDIVGVEFLAEGTTAHLSRRCLDNTSGRVEPVTVAQAMVYLRARWCPTCMARRG